MLRKWALSNCQDGNKRLSPTVQAQNSLQQGKIMMWGALGSWRDGGVRWKWCAGLVGAGEGLFAAHLWKSAVLLEDSFLPWPCQTCWENKAKATHSKLLLFCVVWLVERGVLTWEVVYVHWQQKHWGQVQVKCRLFNLQSWEHFCQLK